MLPKSSIILPVSVPICSDFPPCSSLRPGSALYIGIIVSYLLKDCSSQYFLSSKSLLFPFLFIPISIQHALILPILNNNQTTATTKHYPGPLIILLLLVNFLILFTLKLLNNLILIYFFLVYSMCAPTSKPL